MKRSAADGGLGAKEVAEGLYVAPLDVQRARRSKSEGGVPSEPGLYAWWQLDGALGGVSFVPGPVVGADRPVRTHIPDACVIKGRAQVS